VMALPKALRQDDVRGARAVFRLARDHSPGVAARLHASLTLGRWAVQRLSPGVRRRRTKTGHRKAGG
jgi:hypothetical protein